jgi:hypothetical protein
VRRNERDRQTQRERERERQREGGNCFLPPPRKCLEVFESLVFREDLGEREKVVFCDSVQAEAKSKQ